MLANNPDERPADPDQVVKQLTAIASAEGIDLEKVRALYAKR